MKATHDGTCQVCGNYQKLPGGKLSKHGYTKQWGFFNGTCWGAENLPFELSKDLIEISIARAKESLESTEAESAALKAGRQFEDGTAWAHVYTGYTGRSRTQSPYQWQRVKLVRIVKTYGEGAIIYYTQYRGVSYDGDEVSSWPIWISHTLQFSKLSAVTC